jgi:carboxypeptidase Taq
MSNQAYQKLQERFHRYSAIGQSSSILHWDAATVMPSGSGAGRGEQLAVLAVLAHETLNQDDSEALLLEADSNRETLSGWEAANLNEMKRQWSHANAVPSDLVEASVKAANDCELSWRQAREDNDFAAVLPLLKEVLKLTIETGEAKAQAFDKSLYDALLDTYEPDGSVARIEGLFSDLRSWLPDTISAVIEKQASRPAATLPEGDFSIDRQASLGRALMERVGFNFDQGRLDVSAHPFCGGVPDDVRITTRYSEEDFTSALMGVLHETGHAMYEAGLPSEWRFQPVGASRGMSIHESQSLLVEMQVSRGSDFIAYLAPVAKAAFDGSGDGWSEENLGRLYQKVEHGFIRVDADEVTYPAHVILRFDLEKAMIEGDLPLEDLPAAWNEKMRELLGVTPPDNKLGCLQDIHWYGGAWGYFPTYTLGAMTAAQLYQSAVLKAPVISGELREGNFSSLMAWVGENIHSQASSLTTDEIVKKATGSSLTTAAFKKHITNRYLA